jgi:hypothetical protein
VTLSGSRDPTDLTAAQWVLERPFVPPPRFLGFHAMTIVMVLVAFVVGSSAPRARTAVWTVTVREMKEGPSSSAIRYSKARGHPDPRHV